MTEVIKPSRRGFLFGMGAFAIIPAVNLMPIKALAAKRNMLIATRVESTCAFDNGTVSELHEISRKLYRAYITYEPTPLIKWLDMPPEDVIGEVRLKYPEARFAC